jgi:hypothetical protein
MYKGSGPRNLDRALLEGSKRSMHDATVAFVLGLYEEAGSGLRSRRESRKFGHGAIGQGEMMKVEAFAAVMQWRRCCDVYGSAAAAVAAVAVAVSVLR